MTLQLSGLAMASFANQHCPARRHEDDHNDNEDDLQCFLHDVHNCDTNTINGQERLVTDWAS